MGHLKRVNQTGYVQVTLTSRSLVKCIKKLNSAGFWWFLTKELTFSADLKRTRLHHERKKKKQDL